MDEEMTDTKIKRLVRKYFDSKFSSDTETKFAWWMTSSADDKEREDALSDIWNESVGQADCHTLESLDMLRRKIDPATKNRKVGGLLWGAAAAISLFAFLVGTNRLKHLPDEVGDEYIYVSAAYGQNVQTSLEDSTIVVINSGSTLVYPRHFSKSQRKVFLFGEAIFDVSTDPDRPFTVETQCFDVTALGTKFNVSAYADARNASTTLAEGRTQVKIGDLYGDNSGQTYYLVPNQCLSINKQSGEIAVEEVNAQRRLSWGNGNLIFDGADFNTILKALERKFNVVFMCDHMERMTGSYYVRFGPDESLEEVLDVLNNLSHHFEYRISSDIIFVNPK